MFGMVWKSEIIILKMCWKGLIGDSVCEVSQVIGRLSSMLMMVLMKVICSVLIVCQVMCIRKLGLKFGGSMCLIRFVICGVLFRSWFGVGVICVVEMMSSVLRVMRMVKINGEVWKKWVGVILCMKYVFQVFVVDFGYWKVEMYVVGF